MIALESVNHIEHYSLLRERRPDGRYGRSGPQHSWNSTLPVTGLATFHLQRHSDHHTHPGRRYQLLRIDEHAPELPGGYGPQPCGQFPKLALAFEVASVGQPSLMSGASFSHR
ncbi:hypothetical protein TTY48_13730 [Tsukamurella sp. TY48]|nr:hypothetical protein TTY48_13730 [Tsukamurella sp. TY48]